VIDGMWDISDILSNQLAFSQADMESVQGIKDVLKDYNDIYAYIQSNLPSMLPAGPGPWPGFKIMDHLPPDMQKRLQAVVSTMQGWEKGNAVYITPDGKSHPITASVWLGADGKGGMKDSFTNPVNKFHDCEQILEQACNAQVTLAQLATYGLAVTVTGIASWKIAPSGQVPDLSAINNAVNAITTTGNTVQEKTSSTLKQVAQLQTTIAQLMSGIFQMFQSFVSKWGG
jgi:hypothetical protein